MRPIHTITIGALGLAFALAGLPGSARASTWEIDPTHSRLTFGVRHMMISDVHGEFKKFTGTVNLDDKDPTKSTVEVTIDTNSISTDQDKRDEHLRSADFFDTQKYPTATFKSTKVTKAGPGKYKVVGNLTIKDVTKPVELLVEGPTKPVKGMMGESRSGVSATGKIKRKDFNISWNKTLDGGGVVVGDDVKLEINAELTEKKAAQPGT